MKLALGTVQFGLDYGITNPTGRTSAIEVSRILNLAADSGIRLLDTAAGYGDSEKVLGRTLPVKHAFSIVTKTPALRADMAGDEHIGHVIGSFRRSLEKLGQDRVYGVLVHRADDLLSVQGERLMGALLELKHQGLTKKVGVSVYNAEQIDAILSRYPVDLVQLPISILDQRLIASGHLSSLKSAGVEVHGRSVFLQGLLLMSPLTLPAHFLPMRDTLEEYRNYLESLGLTPLEAALGFVLGLPELDSIIVGVNTAGQLQEILAAQAVHVAPQEMARFALADPAMLDPSQWRLDTR
jgi:aryl-alcohol dehydrogenase-like predicted oxidoreductase